MSRRILPLSAWLFLGWLLCLTVLPFLLIFAMSFFEKSETTIIQTTLTLENYMRASQWLYLKVLLKTFWLALVATLSCLIVGFPVAYYLAKTTGRRRQIGLILLFIPFWTNFILRIFAMVSIFGNHGFVNQLLELVGFGESTLEILYTRAGVYLGLLYNYLPFLIVPIFSALEKLDPAYPEAAFDLGANRIETFLKVTLPNIKEGLIVGSFFVFIPMMGEYVIPDLLGGAKEVFVGNVMVNQFFVMQDWPFGSALAAILCCLLLFALLLKNRWHTEARLTI